jgi:hypothetical protein
MIKRIWLLISAKILIILNKSAYPKHTVATGRGSVRMQRIVEDIFFGRRSAEIPAGRQAIHSNKSAYPPQYALPLRRIN